MNIIGLSIDGSGGDNKRILVNAEHVTHWHADADSSDENPRTTLHFIGGESVTVAQDIWDVCCKIDPEPDFDAGDDETLVSISNVTRRVTRGELTPGTPVTIESVIDYDDGSSMTTVHDTTFVEVEHSEYTGQDYYRCLGGTYSTVQQPTDGNYSFTAKDFIEVKR